MVQTFEQSDSIGLVSSYWLSNHESAVWGSGYPVQSPILSGKECAQWFLRTGISVFGSQTTVMYRSSLVRCRESFYDVSLPHAADLEKCMEILERWDFGFVYQVLSFTRRDNESIISRFLSLQSYELGRYIITQRYAPVFLEAGDAASVMRKSKGEYYRVLARAALRFKGREFWRFHKVGLKALGERETFDWPYVVFQIVVVLLWVISNPGGTILHIARATTSAARRQARRQEGLLRVP